MSVTMTGLHDVELDDKSIPTSFVLDKAMREALREPFPPNQIGQVNKGFGSVDFIGHAAITDRLNKAAPGWTYRVEPVVITGKDGLPHVMAVFGTMTVGGVTRQEVGDVEHMTRYGDELKKAISDFICRGAMRFGVGLDLWSKEQLESLSRETPVPTERPAGVGGPAGAGDTSAPSPAGGTVADGGGRVDSSSSASPASSEGGKATSTGKGSGTSSGASGGKSRSAEKAARKPPESPAAGADVSPDPPSTSASARRFPLDPKDCLHTVGVDVDDRCIDCGQKMKVSA